MTKTLAREWGQFRVNVNAVAFGFMDTRLTGSRELHSTVEVAGRRVELGMPDPARDAVVSMIPLGRLGTPQEAAGGLFFLCSPWSNYVHGQVLNVTGGLMTGMSA